MQTATTRAVEDDDGEFIRLPEEFGFGPDVELTMVRTGDVLRIYPTPRANDDCLVP